MFSFGGATEAPKPQVEATASFFSLESLGEFVPESVSHALSATTETVSSFVSNMTSYTYWKESSESVYEFVGEQVEWVQTQASDNSVSNRISTFLGDVTNKLGEAAEATSTFIKGNTLPILTVLGTALGGAKLVHMGYQSYQKGEYKMAALKVTGGVCLGAVAASITLKSPAVQVPYQAASNWWNADTDTDI